MVKLIITGLRTCDRKETVFQEINTYLGEIGMVEEIISGGSTGVDSFAKEYAVMHQIKHREFVPDWECDLNAASFIRDAKMAAYATHLLVISNGTSKESKNLIQEASQNNLVIKTVGVLTDSITSESVLPSGRPIY